MHARNSVKPAMKTLRDTPFPERETLARIAGWREGVSLGALLRVFKCFWAVYKDPRAPKEFPAAYEVVSHFL